MNFQISLIRLVYKLFVFQFIIFSFQCDVLKAQSLDPEVIKSLDIENSLEVEVKFYGYPLDTMSFKRVKRLIKKGRRVESIDVYCGLDISGRELDICMINRDPDQMEKWPPYAAGNVDFNWYLQYKYSGLEDAVSEVYKGKILDRSQHKRVKIAHIDTGYELNHPGLPENIDTIINLFENENPNDPTDKFEGRGSVQKVNYGHGLGTLCLLAGKPARLFNRHSFKTNIGGNPNANVVVIRATQGSPLGAGRPNKIKYISEAIRIAIDLKCDVISLSHGSGAGKSKIRKAIKEAFDAGIPVVAAAGNNFRSNGFPVGLRNIASTNMAYPGRDPLVIAVSAATYDYKPYHFEYYNPVVTDTLGDCFLEHMQISWRKGPLENNKIAAYAPNLPWANISWKGKYAGLVNDYKPFRLTGGGTSGAVPQVAAALSLYIEKYRDQLNSIPRKEYVNIMKEALFISARKHGEIHAKNGMKKEHFDLYFGAGLLNAFSLIEDRIFAPKQVKAILDARPKKNKNARIARQVDYAALYPLSSAFLGFDFVANEVAIAEDFESDYSSLDALEFELDLITAVNLEFDSALDELYKMSTNPLTADENQSWQVLKNRALEIFKESTNTTNETRNSILSWVDKNQQKFYSIELSN